MSFNRTIFLKDFLAGLTTAFAALALGAAFWLQSGRGAFAGMVAAGIIPIITSIFGGNHLQPSSPTAPMTAVTVAVLSFGQPSSQAKWFITMVLLLAGLIMIWVGVFGRARLINSIPNVVILGFMSGIAVLIWRHQIKKLCGLYTKAPIAGDTTQNVILALMTFVVILVFPQNMSKGTFVFSCYVGLAATSIFVGVLLKAGLDVFEKDYIKNYISKKWFWDSIKNW